MQNKKLWFKAKRYGWGWYPATWQGWLVIVLFIVVMTLNSMRINRNAENLTEVPLNFFIETVALIAILLFICYKTGEKPKWRWGK